MPVPRRPNEVVDRDCLQQMAAGDVAALRRFYAAHVARVWGFAHRLLGDDHEAEEATPGPSRRGFTPAPGSATRRAAFP